MPRRSSAKDYEWRVLRSDPRLPFLSIKLPYTTDWSKNRMWIRGRGRTYINPKSAALREKLARIIRVQRLPWRKKEKVYVHFFVYRPDYRADVQNFIDLLCDGVSHGTNVDDRYFAGSWDWLRVEGYSLILLHIFQRKKKQSKKKS